MSLVNNPFNKKKYFKKENHSKEKPNSSEKIHQKRFQQLYEAYKTQKTKEEEFRKKMISEREKNELAECSFNPKLTKNNSLFKKKPFEGISNEDRNKNKLRSRELLKSDSNIEDLIDRQNKWLENKNNKLNQRIVADAIKNIGGCVFEPEIKKINDKMISNFKKASYKIVEKPDSYLNYIKKNKKFKENKNNSNNKDYKKTKNGRSPNKNKLLKDNDYDYTKHELTENSYLLKNRSNSNFNISNNFSNKSFKIKQKMKRSIPISKLKLTNISDDELYSMIYISEKEKIEKNIHDYTSENMEKLFGDKKQILFKQALEDLHQALINLNISDGEDVDNEHVELNLDENKNMNENENEVNNQ